MYTSPVASLHRFSTGFAQALRKFDRALVQHIPARTEKNILLVLHFHGLCKSIPAFPPLDPSQLLTLDEFDAVISYFKKHGWEFTDPKKFHDGLAEGRHVLLTFDDGYANNLLALPILKKYAAPATFFIATDHVRTNRSFWWDIVHRERRSQGMTLQEITKERSHLKLRPSAEIDAYITKTFGKNSWLPCSDLDRPLTPAELKTMSEDPLVTLGNHTRNHAILTRLSPEEMHAQIRGAQEDLKTMTGKTALIISYPNGDHSTAIEKVAKEEGLELGISVLAYRNPLPIAENQSMHLGRFGFRSGENIQAQCHAIIHDPIVSLHKIFARLNHLFK